MRLVMIKAIVREDKLNDVLAALVSNGFPGATVYKAQGMGGEGGVAKIRDALQPILLPRAVVEVIVQEDFVNKAVETIIKSASTGEVGDGRIFIIPVEAAIRIRTGEAMET